MAPILATGIRTGLLYKSIANKRELKEIDFLQFCYHCTFCLIEPNQIEHEKAAEGLNMQ